MRLVNGDLKHALQRIGTYLDEGSLARRRALRNREFTIVANDCWGAEVYKDLGLPFLTPLIGTFLADPCFLKLAQDGERILRSELRFADESRYEHVNVLRGKKWFPTGVLSDGVEIQFLHFATQREASEKWMRRVARSHFDRLFFKFSAENDPCPDPDDVRRFDRLPIRKIAFSQHPYPDLASVVTIPEYIIDGKTMYARSLRHFDIVRWLNQA